ncbi:MAG: HD domain-containing protein [Chlamydiales bacterium]|nr:HD domain-containing protein [Chlamydiales bacterium]
MQSNHALQQILEFVRPRLLDDPGHDVGHALRVARWTIAFGESGFLDESAIAAALLHDVVNLPKNHPEASKASTLSAELARPLLIDLGFRDVDTICEAIIDHSYSRGATPRSMLGKALQDADRLEALGALGIFRLISTGTKMGASYFHPDDPWAKDRPLDDKRYSLDHFFTKLLKLSSTMNTEGGRQEAQKRTQFLQNFLSQLDQELMPLEDVKK